jgi:long-chain acyl-CoA synthetase
MENSPVTETDNSPIPADWPRVSLKEADDLLTQPGSPLEIEEIEIRGHMTRVWKNAPPTYAALATHAGTHGDKIFVVFEDERVSYGDWFKATAVLAAKLQEMGIVKGDRIAFAMQNLPEWPVIYFAGLSLGAVMVPLNAWWTGPELEFGIADSGAKMLISDGARFDRIKPHLDALPGIETIMLTRARGELDDGVIALESLIGPSSSWGDLPAGELPATELGPDDDATILYTSGTTGKPKGAIATHRNGITNLMSSAYATARGTLRRGEVPPAETEPLTYMLVIPLFHVTGCCAVLLGMMASGSKVVMIRKWDPTRALQLIQDEKVQVTGGVPTVAWQIIEHPDRASYDLSSLESIVYGGAPAAPELVRKIKAEFGASPGSGWGMTETSGTVTGHTAEDYLNRPDSCGPPVAVSDIKIMSEDGTRELPLGEIGELWAFGPQVVRGYWNRPEANAETFVDGWVRTGDLARIDEEGFCYICDRAKDMIIRGGENIYSSEVENCLYDHPAVTDAALIGLPHKILGEEPAAVVHLAPGASATEEELKEWVKQHLAIFKTPVKIVFVEETLPRNANGKILKKDLHTLFFDEADA